MLGEIDRDCFCSAFLDPLKDCMDIADCSGCANIHRKWPTPQQYCEEYGAEWPEDGAVYSYFDDGQGWVVCSLKWAKEKWLERNPIVCAATPCGKPPDDYRPTEGK